MATSGAALQLLEVDAALVRRAIRPRSRDSRKGQNGVVAVVGGSYVYHGAPFLAASAAMRTGADLVYVAAPRVIAGAIRALSPHLIVYPLTDAKLTPGAVNRLLHWLPDVNSVVLGPGLGRQRVDGMRSLVHELGSRGVSVVLDADALHPDVVGQARRHAAVLTPHAGELKRLFGVDVGTSDVERAEVVRAKAGSAQVTILLKGPVDVVSDGTTTFLNRTGSPAMTVGGTGDVLAGIVATLLAQGAPPLFAAAAAAFVNGKAGERAAARFGLHIMAMDVVESLPEILREFDEIAP